VNPGNDWTEQVHRLVDSVRGLVSEAGRTDDAAQHGDCRWCPLCQVAAVVRGERPEVSAALADLLTTTAAALRSFAEAHPTGATSGDPPSDDPPSDDAAGAADDTGEPPPAVQRIEIA
jgi:hypothetical protein